MELFERADPFCLEFECYAQLLIGRGHREQDKRGLAVEVLEHGLQLLFHHIMLDVVWFHACDISHRKVLKRLEDLLPPWLATQQPL